MKPDTIYYFNRLPECQTRYIQTGHKGKKISNFPSVYKKGKHKGNGYIIFRKKSDFYKYENIRFSHTFELARNRIITRLIFLPEYPRQSYGTYKEYGMLIEFSEDFNQLSISFFKGLQEAVPILFQRKLAGKIPEIVKTEVVKLKYRAGLLVS